MSYVTLPPEDVTRCLELARIVAARVKGRPNYDGLSGDAVRRYFVGYLGERAVYWWLRERKIDAHHSVNPDGRSRGADLRVGRVRIDAKAITDPARTSFVIGAARDLSSHVYVAARKTDAIDPASWQIVGWLGRADIAKYPVTGERYGSPIKEIPLAQCRPVHILLQSLLQEAMIA